MLADRASQKGLVLARSTISDMLCLRKGTLPTPTNLVSYLTVCALPADQHGEWVAVREAIAKARGRDRGPSLAKAPAPAERTDDDPMVRVPIKGKKVSWQVATADLPVVKPLLDRAWATLPEQVERQLHEQLEKGTNATLLFTDEPDPAPAPTRSHAQKRPQPHRAPSTWTSGPPVAVKVILCLVLVALIVACVYILINHG